MNLSKSITSINDKELAVAQLTSTQFLYQIIQQQSQSITELKELIVSQSDRVDSLESRISNLLQVATIPESESIKSFNYGDQQILCTDYTGDKLLRYLYCIHDDGTADAWRGGYSADPPSDGELNTWASGKWKLVK